MCHVHRYGDVQQRFQKHHHKGKYPVFVSPIQPKPVAHHGALTKALQNYKTNNRYLHRFHTVWMPEKSCKNFHCTPIKCQHLVADPACMTGLRLDSRWSRLVSRPRPENPCGKRNMDWCDKCISKACPWPAGPPVLGVRLFQCLLELPTSTDLLEIAKLPLLDVEHPLTDQMPNMLPAMQIPALSFSPSAGPSGRWPASLLNK